MNGLCSQYYIDSFILRHNQQKTRMVCNDSLNEGVRSSPLSSPEETKALRSSGLSSQSRGRLGEGSSVGYNL